MSQTTTQIPLYVRYELHVYRDWTFVLEKTGWLRDQIKQALWINEEKKHQDEDEKEPYHYELWRETATEFKFLSGLLPYIESSLPLDPGCIVRKWSPTDFGVGTIPDDYLPGIRLRSYQISACDKILGRNKGIIDLPTRCFVGDTQVLSLDGKERRLDSLQVGERFWVYGCEESGYIVPIEACALGVTGFVDKLLEVELDNGKTVNCTMSHLWMLRDGTYRRADELREGDSLMPLYEEIDEKGYVKFLSNKTGEWIYRYKAVAKYVNGKQYRTALERCRDSKTGCFRELPHVHHKNFSKSNDDPNNLVWLTRTEHRILHRKITGLNVKRGKVFAFTSAGVRERNLKRWKDDPSYRDQMSKRHTKVMNKLWENPKFRKLRSRSARMQAKRGHSSKMSSVLQKKRLDDPNFDLMYRKKLSEAQKERQRKLRNHKVVRIQKILCSPTPVYDLSVPGTNNFALSAGVFVHNSGKTEVAMAVLKKYLESNPDAICLFIEPTTVLMRQTFRKLQERQIPDVGRIGGGFRELHGNQVFSCVIDSLITAVKKKSGDLYKLIQEAKFVFVDESHLMGAPSYVDTLSTVLNYDILLVTSGTPYQDRVGPKTNYRDAWVLGITGGVIFRVSPSLLVDRGWIAQGNVVVMTYDTRRPRFFMRNYRRVYDYFIVNNWKRNSLGANCARDLYERGFKVMILVWRIEHGREMLRLVSEWCGSEAVFAHGSGNEFMEGGEPRPKPQNYDPVVEFNKGNIPVLIGSDVFKLGADLPDLDAVVIMRGEGRKYINTIQSVARCLCPNAYDNKVYIVDFWDGHHPYTKLHSELRVSDYLEVGHQVYRGYEDFVKLIDASSQLRKNAKVLI